MEFQLGRLSGLTHHFNTWLLLGASLLSSGCIAVHVPPGGASSTKEISSIEVSPAGATFALGTSQTFRATAIYSDSTTADVSDQVTWSVLDSGVASINASGVASSVATGSTSVVASLGDGSAEASFTVSAAELTSIQITTAGGNSVADGQTKQYTATGIFSDATTQDITTQVTWSSNDVAVATISNVGGDEGLATAVATGTCFILADLNGITDAIALTVTGATLTSIQVTPSIPSVALGLSKQFTATGIFSDASTSDLTASVTWSSATPAVATMGGAGSEGLAQSVSVGTSVITASSGAISDSTTLTVTAATLVSLAVTPANGSKADGLTQQFTATGTFTDASTSDLTTSVVWSSSNVADVTISNAGGSKGLATAVDPGVVTITATSGAISGSTGFTVTNAELVSIDINPSSTVKAKGLTEPLSATGNYTDGSAVDITADVTWNSSDVSIATVSNAGGSEGLATAIDIGTVTIDAEMNGISGNATFETTVEELVSVAVTASTNTIVKSDTLNLTATGTYTDGSTQNITGSVTWSSSNGGVATVNAGTGVVTAVTNGVATISAAAPLVIAGTITLTVIKLSSIAVTPGSPTFDMGATQQYVATGTYSNGSTRVITTTVTWASSDTATATINASTGVATGVNVGTGKIISATDSTHGDAPVVGQAFATVVAPVDGG